MIDSSLLVQAMSRRAESLLGVTEDSAVNRPVVQLLVPADAEAGRPARFAAALAEAAAGADEPVSAFVRPWNTFGVRLRARIASCGPPRAALVVLEDQQAARGSASSLDAALRLPRAAFVQLAGGSTAGAPCRPAAPGAPPSRRPAGRSRAAR